MRADTSKPSPFGPTLCPIALTIALALTLCACPRGPTSDGTLPGGEGRGGAALAIPEQVTDSNYLEQARALRAAPPGAAGRDTLRSLLIAHLRQRFARALTRDDHTGAWEIFADALRLYPAEELRQGELAPEIAQMAQSLLRIYEPRGDAGRTLTALLVLTLTEASPDPYVERYRRVVQWSGEAREVLPSNTERVIGLIEIFEQVTALIPLSEPVDRLTQLYLERHRLLQGAFNGPPDLLALLSPRGRFEMQSLLSARGRTVLDVVTLYLRAGRPGEVRDAVSGVGNLSGHDRELVQATRNLRSERLRDEALMFLAANLGREHPEVGLELCHAGHREFPRDARFSLCLAELYRHIDDVDGAFEYYEAALEADPSVENFEQALRYMTIELEERLNQEDSRGARQIFERAERVLASFRERYPNAEPPIREDQLTYLIGMGEYNSGNIAAAIERFEASVASRPNRLALVHLGQIAERRGQAEQAIRYYREALDLPGSQDGENPLYRAIILTHLADAYVMAGRNDRAETLYNEALEMLRVAGMSLPPELDPEIMMERGFILHKLGRTDEANEELGRALAVAPQRRATYGRLLSFYVGRGMVQPAVEVYHLAFNHSELERIWKIYFSMWIVGLQRRLGQEPDSVAVRFLESVDGEEWVERLGQFFVGDLSYQALLELAETQGHRAEAYYYQAVLELARGDRQSALQLLQQVIETDMLGYYEYEFARQLQQELASGSAPQQNAGATP